MSSRPSLSVVVISYNMARELPRTLFTLSPQFQIGIEEDEYEIILVDNGSSQPFDEAEYQRIAPNIKVVRYEPAKVSPVDAINHGLALAKGAYTCVMIDGARMASPGLLANALKALSFSRETVVGAVAFHLGPDVQMKSILSGYNQVVENGLLKSIPWRRQGYRLFDISVFAGSSQDGWFTLPAETNALFMSNAMWSDLSGFDPQFVSPGGGLANLDIWKRACVHPQSDVVLLAGEATFHQFHGGVATNSKERKFELFKEEYLEIRGKNYARPDVPFRIFGSFRQEHQSSLSASIRSS